MAPVNLPRTLGDELRAARASRRWTRKDVLCRLPSDIREPTLASYELGSRPLTVVRLVELCQVLDVLAPALLTRALERATGMHLDLRAVARDQRAELWPLRRWAQTRLRGRSTVVRLDAPAFAGMAELCGMSTADLLSALSGDEP